MTPRPPTTLIRTLRNATQRLVDGAIKPPVWEDAFEQALAQYHLAAYAHGAGVDPSKLTPQELELVQKVVDKQLEYLGGFRSAWNDGEYQENPQAAISRAGMYAAATNGTWWMGHTRGWPLPAWPGDGSTQCKSNCKCSWDITVLDGEGNADAYWRLSPVEHCQTCMVRAEDWAPFQIRGGEVVE